MTQLNTLPGLDEYDRVNNHLPCCSCGSDLHDKYKLDQCPGCNRSVIETLYSHIVKLDPAGYLDANFPCIECAYNLRTLHYTAPCPECNTTVERSIHEQVILMMDFTWLKRVRLGYLMIFIGQLLVFASFIDLVIFACPILWIIGSLLIATPLPYLDANPQYRKTRNALRYACLITPCLIYAGLLNMIYFLKWETGYTRFSTQLFGPANYINVLAVELLFLTLLQLFILRSCHLATLFSSSKIRRHFRKCMSLIWYSAIIWIVTLFATDKAIFSSQFDDFAVILGFGFIADTLFGLGTYIFMILTTFKIYRQFNAAIKRNYITLGF